MPELDIAERVLSRIDAVRRDRTLLSAASLLTGAVALEPGGPSALFDRGGLVPVYPRLASLDTLDYAAETLWSDAPQADNATATPIRRRLIAEAGRLRDVEDDS